MTTKTAPDAAGILAEGRWLWRRLYAFLTSAAAWVTLERLAADAPPEAAQELARHLILLLTLTVVLYLVGPTAQQLIAGASILKGGR